MDRIPVAVRLCAQIFRRWGRSSRIAIWAILSFLWVHYLVSPIAEYAAGVGVPASPWIFPALTARWYCHMVLLLSAVLLFGDAPFISDGTPYEYIRSGKRAFLRSRCLYVLSAALVDTLFLVAAGGLCLLPRVTLTADWGAVYNTLARTSAGAAMLKVPYSILRNFTPLQAMTASALLFWLEVSLIGMGMLFFSKWSRSAAVCCGLVLAFLPAFGAADGRPRIYYLLPTAWADLTVPDFYGKSAFPSAIYAFSVLVGLILLLTVCIRLSRRNAEVDLITSM